MKRTYQLNEMFYKKYFYINTENCKYLSFIVRSLSIQSAVFIIPPHTIIFQDIQDSCHLTEDQNPWACLGKKVSYDFIITFNKLYKSALPEKEGGQFHILRRKVVQISDPKLQCRAAAAAVTACPCHGTHLSYSDLSLSN